MLLTALLQLDCCLKSFITYPKILLYSKFHLIFKLTVEIKIGQGGSWLEKNAFLELDSATQQDTKTSFSLIPRFSWINFTIKFVFSNFLAYYYPKKRPWFIALLYSDSFLYLSYSILVHLKVQILMSIGEWRSGYYIWKPDWKAPGYP